MLRLSLKPARRAQQLGVLSRLGSVGSWIIAITIGLWLDPVCHEATGTALGPSRAHDQRPGALEGADDRAPVEETAREDVFRR